jgi:hypothetical protein
MTDQPDARGFANGVHAHWPSWVPGTEYVPHRGGWCYVVHDARGELVARGGVIYASEERALDQARGYIEGWSLGDQIRAERAAEARRSRGWRGRVAGWLTSWGAALAGEGA